MGNIKVTTMYENCSETRKPKQSNEMTHVCNKSIGPGAPPVAQEGKLTGKCKRIRISLDRITHTLF